MTFVTHAFPELTATRPGTPLSAESEAVLRQYSLQRLLAYGCDFGDATRARFAVEQGAPWKESCIAVADSVLATQDAAGLTASPATWANRERRASAMLRMAQIMMLQDSEERTLIYRRAAQLFDAASRRDGSCSRVEIDCGTGTLVGWLLKPAGGSTRRVVVAMGGIEGWAMDFESSARPLVERGLAVLVIDGPGQGESRFEHATYLTPQWQQQFSRVLDHLQQAHGAESIGIFGNSAGGNFAMQFAAADPRVAACCNNGGIRSLAGSKARGNFFMKVQAFCNPDGSLDADAMWEQMQITEDSLRIRCPFLLVHGQEDPLVSQDDSRTMFNWCTSADKQMHVFAKGDHCVYNQPGARLDLIGDWFASRL